MLSSAADTASTGGAGVGSRVGAGGGVGSFVGAGAGAAVAGIASSDFLRTSGRACGAADAIGFAFAGSVPLGLGAMLALRPTPRSTRFTSRASRAIARRPAARFTGMSAASSSSTSAGRPLPGFRRAAAVREGVPDPLASSSFTRSRRTLASASPELGSFFGRTRATVPSSLMNTVRGSTSPPPASAPSAISSAR